MCVCGRVVGISRSNLNRSIEAARDSLSYAWVGERSRGCDALEGKAGMVGRLDVDLWDDGMVDLEVSCH